MSEKKSKRLKIPENPAEAAKKGLSQVLKVIPGMLKIIPLSIKALVFLVVSLPKMLFKLIKGIFKFIKKATPNVFGITALFIIIFFGFQILIKNLLGSGANIPPLVLALFALYIIFSMVVNNSSEISLLQQIILKIFLKIFNNDITKDLLNFDVKVDRKNPKKSLFKILKWINKNLLKTILTLMFLAFLSKIFISKIWKYSTILGE